MPKVMGETRKLGKPAQPVQPRQMTAKAPERYGTILSVVNGARHVAGV
ncbi:hypothetical protein M3N55_10255 [Roseibaca sp. V10]|uniref:Uncharacterized protein n=1 Tax=Roseinatronobacter domitianus TaxID=2940293 RepID=A0ABT0M384_9RHOB|nr:hypothetical protein [Roseibaca domitiana]MCL1629113.1 hypothetical protein [Roseibaca domitiana]